MCYPLLWMAWIKVKLMFRFCLRGKLLTVNPPLYLQLDNCKENKNKVLFGFLSDLVERGVFDAVQVGFLMIGHTHEDIDQFLSVISAWLKKWETICPDIDSLLEEIQKASTTKGMKPPEVFITLQGLNGLSQAHLYLLSLVGLCLQRRKWPKIWPRLNKCLTTSLQSVHL